jgi:hypothetical protein
VDNECLLYLILGESYAAAVWRLNQEERQTKAGLPIQQQSSAELQLQTKGGLAIPQQSSAELQLQQPKWNEICCNIHLKDSSKCEDWVYQFQHVRLKLLLAQQITRDFHGVAASLQAARAFQDAELIELNKSRHKPFKKLRGLPQILATAEGTSHWNARVKYWQGVMMFDKLTPGTTRLLSVVEDCLVRIIKCHVSS